MERKIHYLVIDVDGTMTDGGIYYDENGNEMKKFCTRDAAGFFAARSVGIKIVVITGRKCEATFRRMKELKVDYIYQDIKDKETFLSEFMKTNGISREEIGYIGDDLNDLLPMKMVGYVGCPADSCKEVKKLADYISSVKGGSGAVRDVVEHFLCESGEWDEAISVIYGAGR